MKSFDLSQKTVIITGGAGLLGEKHAEAVLEAGGTAILLDIDQKKLDAVIKRLKKRSDKVEGMIVDITKREEILTARDALLKSYSSLDVLINNAANNPKMEGDGTWSRLEEFPEEIWNKDLDIGLKGAFLCSSVFGSTMAKQGNGVILNISSDLGIIAPDQRLYRKKGTSDDKQPVKPVTYSVVKHGLIGLTRYLATYWADKGVRANALCPGGVYNGQPDDFVKNVSNLIPLGRMARKDEYKSAVLFMISDASSYMNGAILNMDGGRTSW